MNLAAVWRAVINQQRGSKGIDDPCRSGRLLPFAVLSVAAFLKSTERFRGKTVVLLLSGARIGLDSLKEVLA